MNKEDLIQRAVKYFGTTHNPYWAGFILSDGRMLDFSGKKLGNVRPDPKTRYLDHTDIGDIFTGKEIDKFFKKYPDASKSNVYLIHYFLDQTGSIRMGLTRDDLSLQIFKYPTPQQFKTIKEIIENYLPASGYAVIDFKDGYEEIDLPLFKDFKKAVDKYFGKMRESKLAKYLIILNEEYEKYLFEKSISQLKGRDIEEIIKTYKDYIDDPQMEDFFEEFKQEEYIDKEIDYNDLKDYPDIKKQFEKRWFNYQLEIDVEDTITFFESLSAQHNGKIPIYRVMVTDDRFFDNLLKRNPRLGIFWSYKKEAAEPHWGYGQKDKNYEILIESEIDEKYVDWIDTIALNAHPIYKEECEIRLFKNTPRK